MVTTTQLQNCINIRSTTMKGDAWRTHSKGIILRNTRPYHCAKKRVRMTINHLALNNAKLATFKKVKFVPRLRNIALLDTTMIKSNGIPIHGGLTISHDG